MIHAIGFKVCLFPNKTQTKELFRFTDTCRGLYNILLGEAIRAYTEEGIKTTFNYLYSYYKSIKNEDKTKWIKEIPEACGKQICKDLVESYKRVFKSDFGFPKFKKKGKCKPSFYQRTDAMYFVENKIRITGIGFIKCNKGDYPTSGYCNPRVTFDGKHWYLSFSIKGNFGKELDSYNEGVGIDLGIETFATVNNGTKFFNYNNDPELIRLDAKLKKLQAILSKKYESNKVGNKFVKTKNIIKLERKIKLLHRRIHNIKLNYVHSYSSTLVKTKPEFIAVEGLSIKDMKEEEDNYFSRSIQKLMWHEFLRQLEYKSNCYEIKFIKVDRYFHSSQLCSKCGNRQDMPPNIRIYKCSNCKIEIDRDLNAAINIQREGKRLLAG